MRDPGNEVVAQTVNLNVKTGRFCSNCTVRIIMLELWA